MTEHPTPLRRFTLTLALSPQGRGDQAPRGLPATLDSRLRGNDGKGLR